MTCAYGTYFVLLWASAVAAIPGAIALFAWGVAHYADPLRLGLGLGLGALLVVWTIYLRLHGPRVQVRAGAWPALCTGDAFPRTEEELAAAVARIVAEHGRPPTVVGSGWGFFLYRRGAVGPRLFLHRFKGRVGETRRWRAGTTIHAVDQSFVETEGLTFPSHPTMDYIGIGAWFACNNHGNQGQAAVGTEDLLKNARVLDMLTNTVETLEFKELRTRFDGPNAKNFCILDVEFKNLVPNDDVQKRGIVIDSADAAAEWLNPTVYLRLLFVGAARDHGVGVQWLPVYDPTRHGGKRDPHCCSRFCTFLQVDVCSAVCGWYESATYEENGVKMLTKYTGVTTRSQANKWIPSIWPLQTISVVLAGFLNFELFFKLDERLDGRVLWQLVQAVIAMHKKHGGRSEIRHAGPESVICLDVSMNRDRSAPFRMLRETLGVEKVALHPGKFNALSTAPLKRVAWSDLYT